MGRRRKSRGRHRGHGCWACGRARPNERFGGRGHGQHLCNECSRLGADELEVRQAALEVDRCLGAGGLIQRKAWRRFEPLLAHPNPRARELVVRALTEDRIERVRRRAEDLLEMMRIDAADEEGLFLHVVRARDEP